MTDFEKNIVTFNQQLTADAISFRHAEPLSRQRPDALIVCGMGGSGLAGRLLRDLAPDLGVPVPVWTWSDYGLPRHPFKNPLFIFISFSGATAETLSALENAPADSPRAVVTTGGKLKDLAQQRQLPLATFAAGALQPRQATGHLWYALIGLIQKVFPGVTNDDLAGRLHPEENRRPGQELAARLAKKIILIYAESTYSSLAYNWKDRLNETGKALAFANALPEMCHNELVSFETRPPSLIALFLNNPNGHPENKKRARLVAQLLRDRGTESINCQLTGVTAVEKIFQSINLADWTAFYLAAENGADPAAVAIIEELKRLMA